MPALSATDNCPRQTMEMTASKNLAWAREGRQPYRKAELSRAVTARQCLGCFFLGSAFGSSLGSSGTSKGEILGSSGTSKGEIESPGGGGIMAKSWESVEVWLCCG